MKQLSILAAFILLSGCLKDDPMNKPFKSFVPEEINDGLVISTPEEQDIDPEKLTDIYTTIYADENLWPLRSMRETMATVSQTVRAIEVNPRWSSK